MTNQQGDKSLNTAISQVFGALAATIDRALGFPWWVIFVAYAVVIAIYVVCEMVPRPRT